MGGIPNAESGLAQPAGQLFVGSATEMWLLSAEAHMDVPLSAIYSSSVLFESPLREIQNIDRWLIPLPFIAGVTGGRGLY
jgi:hypothetical protein